jgi:hypothetical protein
VIVSIAVRRFARPLVPFGLVIATACNAPSTIVLTPLEVVIGSGDGQFAVVNTQIQAPLRVVARTGGALQPKEGVTILWDVLSGGASLVGPTSVVTDSTGSAEVRVRLGPLPGEVVVRARVSDQQGVSVSFHAFGVNRPTLAPGPTSGAAGDTITLTGTGFSPTPVQDVVLFSGVRGRVVSASGTTLRVVVPTCLPGRVVNVHVQLGVVASADTLSFTVTSGGSETTIPVGGVLDVADEEGFACHLLGGGAGASYLAIVYSASTTGAARHPFQLTALSSVGPPLPAASAGAPAGSASGAVTGTNLQATWDQHVRDLETELVRGRKQRTRASGAPAAAPPAAVPALGEVRSFNVLNAQGGFERVGAVARSVSSQAAIFVDTLAPAGGFAVSELDALAARFDQRIYPRVTTTFGAASDLDANDRVVILFTPAVNRLTPPGSSSFIGGFFYGVDLLPSTNGSNAGEVFYAIVPDPTGIHGNNRSKSQVASVVPAILAHEFQHMVHFNERILVRDASGQEALWLAEGLAQMAEEMVARDYELQGDTASRNMFRSGARQRSRTYLQRADTVSVIVTTGQGSLAERGAGFLHLLYVEDQLRGDALERLTQTTLTGVANVEAVVGKPWPALLADWWAATYLDAPDPETGPLTYPHIDLKGYLAPFPLSPSPIGASGASASGLLWSSSAAYYIVTPGVGVSIALRLGGDGGAASPAHAALRIRMIRVS